METFDIIFFSIVAITLPILLWHVSKRVKRDVERARKSMLERGYVIDVAYMKNRGYITRIWSKYAQPMALYLQISDLDIVSVFAGQLGIADIKVGDDVFDARYVVRSNNPDLAKVFLNPELCQKLLGFRDIRFRTGSLDSLVGVDHFPEQKTYRDTRQWWMMEMQGELDDPAQNKLLELGRQLAARVEEINAMWMGPKNFDVGIFEGR